MNSSGDLCMKPLIYIAVCLSLSSITSAELYKWVDENGKVYYTDKDPALDNKKPASTEIIKAEPANVFSSEEAKTLPTPRDDVSKPATNDSSEPVH